MERGTLITDEDDWCPVRIDVVSAEGTSRVASVEALLECCPIGRLRGYVVCEYTKERKKERKRSR